MKPCTMCERRTIGMSVDLSIEQPKYLNSAIIALANSA